MTAVFLVLIGSLYGRAMTAAEGTDYTITTRKQAQTAVTPEPMPLVDINSADAQLLQTLDGIGPALADRIIAYREANGPFETVDELLQVSGIGENTLEGFSDRVTVAADASDIPAKEAEK